MITDAEKTKAMNALRHILEPLHIKNPLYNTTMSFAQEIALNKIRKIARNSVQKKPTQTGKKIILTSVHGTYLEAIYKEAAFAKALQCRNNQVKMLFCDTALYGCAVLFTRLTPPDKWTCKNCRHFSENFVEMLGVPRFSYFDFLSKQDINKLKNIAQEVPAESYEQFTYQGINIGHHTQQSISRFFKGDDPKENPRLFEKILRIRLSNALVSAEVAKRVIKTEKPDLLLTSHGCYSEFGPITEVFMKKNIPVRIWTSGDKRDTVTFDRQHSEQLYNNYVKQVRNHKKLTPQEQKKLDAFFSKRMSGKEGQVRLYGFSAEQSKNLEKTFAFKKYDTTFVLFPNVPWDAAVFTSDSAFPNVYDWISHTIKIIQKNPHLQLIIKIHPSEIRVMESKRTLLDYINEHMSPLPKNIYLIPPDTTISPYALFPHMSTGIVYTGTVGLEMATQGIPVITAGNAHYAQKGFTYDTSTEKEYTNLLTSDLSLTEKQIQKARVYAYFYFIKNYVPLDFLYIKNFLNIGWDISSFNAFNEGENKYLDHICDYIINGGIFQDW